MTRTLALLPILVLLPGFVFGQPAGASSERGSMQNVQVGEVEVGFGMKLMQAASIALNPMQRNTHWPLFAYPANEVFENRECNSFADTPLEGEVAFVQKIEAGNSTDSEPLITGIRIQDASDIRDICESADYSEMLRQLAGFKQVDGDWYLLSERPLQHVASSFRTSAFTVSVGVNNGNPPNVTAR